MLTGSGVEKGTLLGLINISGVRCRVENRKVVQPRNIKQSFVCVCVCGMVSDTSNNALMTLLLSIIFQVLVHSSKF